MVNEGGVGISKVAERGITTSKDARVYYKKVERKRLFRMMKRLHSGVSMSRERRRKRKRRESKRPGWKGRLGVLISLRRVQETLPLVGCPALRWLPCTTLAWPAFPSVAPAEGCFMHTTVVVTTKVLGDSSSCPYGTARHSVPDLALRTTWAADRSYGAWEFHP